MFDKKIQLNLLSPMCSVRPVFVLLSQPVQILHKLFPNEKPRKFFFNGQILSESHSFGFYSFKDKDSIIAISNQQENQGDQINSFWTQLSKNNDSFQEIINWATYPPTAKELARLRDLHMNKLERKPSFFKKLSATRLAYEESARPVPIITKTYYEKPKEITSEPLPSFW